MRNGKFYIVIGIILGALAWVTDAAADSLFFSGGPFWESLIAAIPAHEACMRSVTVAALVGSGVAVSVIMSRQRRAEATLRESEERFRATFEQAAVGIAHVAPDGRILRVNQRLCEIIGYTRQELLARTFHDITHPDDLEADCRYVDRMLAGQIATYSMEKRYHHKNGSVVWANLTVALVREPSGSPKSFISVVEDITERKQAETRLADTRSLLLAAIEQSPAGIIIADAATGGMILVNRAAEEITGRKRDLPWAVPPSDLSHLHWEMFYSDGSPWPLEDLPIVRALLHGETTENAEAMIRRADGTERWILVDGSPVRSDRGKIIGGVVVFADITECKRAEEALQRGEQWFRSLFRNVPIGIYRTTPDGRILTANPALVRLLGYGSFEDLAQRDLETEGFHPEYPRSEFKKRVTIEGEVIGMEAAWERADGSVVFVRENARAVRGDDGKVLYYEGTVEDVTELKRAEGERRARVRLLEVTGEIDRIIREAADLEQMLEGVLRSVLAAFDCDRAFLLYPCDPGAESWRAPTECTRPEYPGAFVADGDQAMTPTLAEAFRRLLACSGAVTSAWAPGETDGGPEGRFGVRAQVSMAIRPREGKPWVFGVHECSRDREWTRDELTLLEAIGRRMTDGLSSLLFQRRLQESEERYRALVETSPYAVTETDLEGRIAYASPRALRLHGCDRPEELVGRSAVDFVAEEERGRATANLRKVLDAGAVPDVEYTFLRNDGTRFPGELSAALIRDAQGQPKALVAITRDISDRKRTEEALRQSEEKFRHIVDSSPMGMHMYELQPDGRLIFVDANPAADKILGVDNARFLGKDIEEAFPAAIPTGIAERYRVAARDGTPWSTEQFVYHDGSLNGVFEVHAFQTSPGRMVAVFSDVSERRRTQEALRESEEKFRGIAERSFDMIFTTDLKGNVTYLSPAAKRIFHAEPEEMVGRHFTKFLIPAEVPRAARLFAQRMNGVDHGVVPLEAMRNDGQRVSVELNSWPILEGGAIVGIQGIIRDTTERRQAEKRLRRMETQLAHVARLSTLGELVAGIAHEVSQPLYCVVNFAKATSNVLTAEGEPNLRDVREWNEEIALAARRAGEIITRLRNFVRRREMQRARVDIDEVARESVELVAFETRSRGVALRLDLSKESKIVDADRVQIQQVLVNLLCNAYEVLEDMPTAEREIAVRTAVVGRCVEVSVADNGPGLPADDLKIFEAFVTTKPDGLGMGLAISRTIVEAHEGRLWALPNRPRGTTFRFTLPVAEGDRADGRGADGLRR